MIPMMGLWSACWESAGCRELSLIPMLGYCVCACVWFMDWWVDCWDWDLDCDGLMSWLLGLGLGLWWWWDLWVDYWDVRVCKLNPEPVFRLWIGWSTATRAFSKGATPVEVLPSTPQCCLETRSGFLFTIISPMWQPCALLSVHMLPLSVRMLHISSDVNDHHQSQCCTYHPNLSKSLPLIVVSQCYIFTTITQCCNHQFQCYNRHSQSYNSMLQP